MKFVFSILCSIIYISILQSEIPIGIISKTIGSVKYSSLGTNTYKTVSAKNIPIYLNSKILTKKNSFAKIIYFDDRSTISIYPNSEILFKGSIENKLIIKEIEIFSGIILVSLDEKIGTNIQSITQYSEVKCVQCSYWVISKESMFDKFILDRGSGSVYNPSMNNTINLHSDSTIVSRDSQAFEVLETPITEIKYLESLVLNADEKLIEYDQNTETNLTSNILIIKLRNAANIEKEVVISYKEKDKTKIE
tara:strand:+ start:967 stop:1716 length:750 start_codon:yes stop_codon:yes gene_type:complete